MQIGIYKITNLLNGQIYIGQSRNIERRFKQHQYKNKTLIDKDINKFGIENFSFEIIEKCKLNELNEKEQYWIKYYNSYNNGYNQNRGGGINQKCYRSINEETVEKIKKDIRQSQLNLSEIAKKYNIDKSTITRINQGEIHYKNQEKYPIREVTIPSKKIYYCKQCNKVISNGCTLCDDCYQKFKAKKSKINLITREELKKRIKQQPFTSIAKDFKVTDNTIRKWCEKYNLPTKKKDIQKYSDEEWLLI